MIKRIITLMLVVIFMIPSAYASSGESGYFSGISEGIKLPKTISEYTESKKNKSETLYYKEILFITGEPIEVIGTITITKNDSDEDTDTSGTYKESYSIEASSADNTVTLERDVALETTFVKYDGIYSVQIKRDSTVTDWSETVTVDGVEYEIDEDLSDFGKGRNLFSCIEDKTPGISYYNGNISYRMVYMVEDEATVGVTVEGEVYGYNQPWSKAENQKLTLSLESLNEEDFQMLVELKPFTQSKKTIEYDSTQLVPISFAGTYTQVFQTFGGLDYKILTSHPDLTDDQMENSISIPSTNDFEKLKLPSQLAYVDDYHYAKEDIQKLISMEIFEDSPLQFQPYEAINRGDFVKALCKAMNIKPEESTSKKNKDPIIIFSDISPEHPLYEWLLEAYNVKLVKGVGESKFNPEKPLTRQEAFTMLIRVLGLERLGINPTSMTKYIDDDDIAFWAKDAIYAGTNIGLFKGDQGKLYPKRHVSKAESAAIINRLIDYLRVGIIEDYRQID